MSQRFDAFFAFSVNAGIGELLLETHDESISCAESGAMGFRCLSH
jgi:hypothetical protein